MTEFFPLLFIFIFILKACYFQINFFQNKVYNQDLISHVSYFSKPVVLNLILRPFSPVPHDVVTSKYKIILMATS